MNGSNAVQRASSSKIQHEIVSKIQHILSSPNSVPRTLRSMTQHSRHSKSVRLGSGLVAPRSVSDNLHFARRRRDVVDLSEAVVGAIHTVIASRAIKSTCGVGRSMARGKIALEGCKRRRNA